MAKAPRLNEDNTHIGHIENLVSADQEVSSLLAIMHSTGRCYAACWCVGGVINSLTQL